MTISAFDVDSYNKPGFDFGAAFAEGYRAGYVKLGGDNIPRYCSGGYTNFMDRFTGAGFAHRGSYWVTGGYDPAGSARFYLANRDPRTTFDVLDNETLDDGRSWSDAEACEFFDVLIAAGLTDLWQYGSRDSLWNTHAWPGLEARGIKAIVAIYNGTPFSNVYPRTYPAELVQGHQFTSSASIGGLGAVDENAFVDHAFTGGGTPEPKKETVLELGEETMSAPIYARGDKLDVWYALYTNCQDSTVPRDSGQIYSGRRKVSAGERAIVEGYQKQTGKLHPLSDQTAVIVIPQATFDAINKVLGSDA